MPFNKDDFLTGEEVVQTQVPETGPEPSIPVTPMEPNMDANIPDLEKMEGTPNVQRRQEINKMVDDKISTKVTTIEDQIQKDIQNAQKKKFEGVATHPKDILKQLIAQGEYIEDAQLFGHTWTLRALDQGDQLMSLDEVKDTLETASSRVIAMMFGAVVFSVQAIDGVSIYEWFDEIKITDFKDNMEYHIAVRKAFKKYLEAMPPTVIEILYEKYLEVDEKRNKALDELKNF
jgi:hypothetical protein